MGVEYENQEKLIAVIFERRAIWDFKDPDYHNRERRKALWDEICVELNAKCMYIAYLYSLLLFCSLQLRISISDGKV